jgi:hypothetical protein
LSLIYLFFLDILIKFLFSSFFSFTSFTKEWTSFISLLIVFFTYDFLFGFLIILIILIWRTGKRMLI